MLLQGLRSNKVRRRRHAAPQPSDSSQIRDICESLDSALTAPCSAPRFHHIAGERATAVPQACPWFLFQRLFFVDLRILTQSWRSALTTRPILRACSDSQRAVGMLSSLFRARLRQRRGCTRKATVIQCSIPERTDVLVARHRSLGM